MSGGIFISYRRADSRHAAGRLADELGAAFGEANIFRDIEGIDLGVNFEQALERALGSCVVMLVLIGPQWLDARDDAGHRRLDHAADWTRQEIATALQRGIPVVPVLLESAALPRAEQLPANLQELANRQQFELSDTRWRGDVQVLIDKLARVPGLKRVGPAPAQAPSSPTPAPPAARGGSRKPLFLGIGLGAGALLVLGAVLSERETGPARDDGITAATSSVRQVAATPAVATVTNAELPAPAATRQVDPAPVALAPAEPTLPNLAGLWRTSSGETYHFQQSGLEVRFSAEANGQSIGNGAGELEGNMLRLQMTLQMNGMFLGNLVCNMQGAPDMRSFTGMCIGPRGQFAAQFFR